MHVSSGSITIAPILVYIAQWKSVSGKVLIHVMWNGFTHAQLKSHSLIPLVLSWLVCLSGVAVLGESSWSQGDSEILEPGKEEMMIMDTELWGYNSIKCFIVLFGQWISTLFPSISLLTPHLPMFAYVRIENPVHTKRTIPRGDHKLPAGGPGRQVLSEGQVAVHGSGWGPGTEEQHQVKQ